MLTQSSRHLVWQLFKVGLKIGTVSAGAGAAALAYSMWVEPFNIQFERLTIRLPRATGRLPKEGLRILHLSDSHFHGGDRTQRERAKINRIRQMTRGLEYDLLVHTGDFWHDNPGLDNVLALLDAVPQPKLGSYGVFGNHDYAHFDMAVAPKRMWNTFSELNPLRHSAPLEVAKHLWNYLMYMRRTPLDGPVVASNHDAHLYSELERWGMTLLHNQSVHLQKQSLLPEHILWAANGSQSNGSQNKLSANGVGTAVATALKPASYVPPNQSKLDVYLAGVDDWYMGKPDLARAIADVPVDAPLILLSHNPDIVDDPNLARADLVISGHTHGGQLVLPVWGPAHTQSTALERHEVAGYTRRGQTQIYISRGLGEGIPLRFRAQPQITLITVTA